MPVVQQNSGTWNGTSAVITLPSPSSAGNLLVITINADVTMNTLSGWSLRASQVNEAAHYLWTKQGDGASSWTFTATSALPGSWHIEEVENGVYINASGQNSVALATTYNTTSLTPTAGERRMLASIGGLSNSGCKTVSGWTNSYIEQSDRCSNVAAYPMQGVAAREVVANGSTAYSTTATYSGTEGSRTAIHAIFATSSGEAPVYAGWGIPM